MAKVLLVDDELTMVQIVAEMLRSEGHEVAPFTNGPAAIEGLTSFNPDLVITDLYVEKNRAVGLDILQKAKAMNPPPQVILMTAYGTVEMAVEAMRKGAYDFVEKPFKLDELKLCVQRALSYNDAVTENLFLRKQLNTRYRFNQIIGTSPKMQEVFRMIERVADTDSTILILGESGTGKELVARALHFNSRRQNAPFVPINCSALPENLLESELFGHRKGAFTGAINDKKGLFQEADGGTMFLDEIASMPALLQSRLLRVLQEKEVRRVGENVPFYVNVRVLAATNEPLEKRMKAGQFREDLYYRLNVIAITLPPLRDRKEDLPLLVSHFLREKVSPRTGKPFRITRQALAALQEHPWPGNVRELENAVERACALCEGDVLQLSDFPPTLEGYASKVTTSTEIDQSVGATPSGYSTEAAAVQATPDNSKDTLLDGSGKPIESLKEHMHQQELSHIRRALALAEGDKEKAAQILGVSLATLYRKLVEISE